MADEQLLHKEHELDWEQHNYKMGRFLYCFCITCGRTIGNLNINDILDRMELED